MDKKKVLWIGDGAVPTGFSTVNHNIIKRLDQDKYDIYHLALNYNGDPHDYSHKMFPAMIGGDVWGFGRLPVFSKLEPDVIFILNDIYIINKYLEIIKANFGKKQPKIILYFPVDSTEIPPMYYKHFDIVNRAVAYTKFGRDEVKSALPNFPVSVIEHGVDSNTFFKIDAPKSEIRKGIFAPEIYDELKDSFIILNANRNQPRKRIDTTMEGFALFSQNKPENVKLYLHMGLKDAGWDIAELIRRYNLGKRIILTSTDKNTQMTPVDKLNVIYNATDVGINTSTGEGWGLVNMEHAVTGAPQIVPNHSACAELYGDCGILLPIAYTNVNEQTMTRHSYVSAETVAAGLEVLYNDENLRRTISENGYKKFTDKKYSWDTIINKWNSVFDDVCQ